MRGSPKQTASAKKIWSFCVGPSCRWTVVDRAIVSELHASIKVFAGTALCVGRVPEGLRAQIGAALQSQCGGEMIRSFRVPGADASMAGQIASWVLSSSKVRVSAWLM